MMSNEGQLVLSLAIPLSNTNQIFEVFAINSYQFLLAHDMVLDIELNYQFIAVKLNKAEYILLTGADVANCKGREVRRCPFLFPTFPRSRSSCEFSLINQANHSEVLQLCHTVVHSGRQPRQLFALAPSVYYAAATKPEGWYLTCEGQSPVLAAPCGACIVQLPCGCALATPDGNIAASYQRCGERLFRSHYTFNPFLVTNVSFVDSLPSAMLYTNPPLSLPLPVEIQQLQTYLHRNLQASSTMRFNYTKVLQDIIQTNDTFVAADRHLHELISSKIQALNTKSSFGTYFVYGLTAGEVLLFLLLALVAFSVKVMASLYRHPIPHSQAAPIIVQADSRPSPLVTSAPITYAALPSAPVPGHSLQRLRYELSSI